jgi:hypothetical protein
MLPLLNLKMINGLSNIFMDELFSLGQATLARWVLYSDHNVSQTTKTLYALPQ